MTTRDAAPSATTRPTLVADVDRPSRDSTGGAIPPPGAASDTPPVRSAGGPAGRSGMSRWLGWGALSGFLAGGALSALHSWFAVSTGQDALAPFRTIATLVEGPPPALATAGIGMVVHAALSVLFGLLFAAALAPLRRRSAGWLTWAGLLFGGALYLVDFQVFARNVKYFSAFQDATSQPFELATHLVFGAVLAALMLLAKPRTAVRPSRSAAPGKQD
jgi:hypothetical protein